MIDVFGARNFGCLKDVELRLTKLHALVGPNDSGKSTILRGIRTISHVSEGRALFINGTPRRSPLPFEPPIDVSGLRLHAGADGLDAILTRRNADIGWRIEFEGRGESDEAFPMAGGGATNLPAALKGARIVRWTPDSMRRPTGHQPEVDTFLERGGLGLPGVLARVFLRDESALAAVNTRLRALFPTIASFRVSPVDHSSELQLEFTLASGEQVGAADVSDGVLYTLAFIATEYIASAHVLLLEEPENGLHPARITDVIQALRKLTDTGGTQIVMATHSPLILNELRPDEVTVVTRTARAGTRATPIAETKNFAARAEVYALGELWLSYCDGRLEEQLVDAKAR